MFLSLSRLLSLSLALLPLTTTHFSLSLSRQSIHSVPTLPIWAQNEMPLLVAPAAALPLHLLLHAALQLVSSNIATSAYPDMSSDNKDEQSNGATR